MARRTEWKVASGAVDAGRGVGGFDVDQCNKGCDCIRVQKKFDFIRAMKWEDLVTVFVGNMLEDTASSLLECAFLPLW